MAKRIDSLARLPIKKATDMPSQETPVPKEPSGHSELVRPLAAFALMGMAQLVFSAFFLLFVYGIVVIVFRQAFGVQLWNPFG